MSSPTASSEAALPIISAPQVFLALHAPAANLQLTGRSADLPTGKPTQRNAETR